MCSIKLILSFSSLTLFVLYCFLYGTNFGHSDGRFMSPDFPDLSRYVSLQSLSAEQFPLDDVNKRVIIVGDIHGMAEELNALLAKVLYDPSSDVLISVGDIVAKGSHAGSMDVLEFMASNNITAVRGNHDQKVIEWRTWMEWIHYLGGRGWLKDAQRRWEKAQEQGADDVDDWVEDQAKHDKKHGKWWKKIPEGWTLFGDHFKVAEKMTHEQYTYMLQRPLQIHVPHAHTFIAHGGILSSDPNYKAGHKRQPLAHIPILPESDTSYQGLSGDVTSVLRHLQELAILNDVPQNLIPWNTLNMRGVLDDHTVTRGKDGTPWTDLYKKDMKRCNGFDSDKRGTLQCHPATVIYGHAASRGLDIKRWTIGLDSGCVYNRRMTALVLGGKAAASLDLPAHNYYDGEAIDVDGNILSSRVKFGDSGHGKIYSVSCK